jgi:hypothetical protein
MNTKQEYEIQIDGQEKGDKQETTTQICVFRKQWLKKQISSDISSQTGAQKQSYN